MAFEFLYQRLQRLPDRRVITLLTDALNKLFPPVMSFACGSSLNVTPLHAGAIINLDTAAGSTAILPAATGSGIKYRFRVTVLATSNSHIVKVNNTTDVMNGFAALRDDTADNAVMFFTAASSDTITLNRTTTGSVVLGEIIEVEDIAAGVYLVKAFLANTGASATPFSATV